MQPTFLVLASLTPSGELSARYAAALGACLPAHLRLLHIYHDPGLDPELVTITTAHAIRSQEETLAQLTHLARQLPVPAQARLSVQGAFEAVREAVRCYQPLLVVAGLSAEQDLLDYFLHNQALPALRATHRPLMLIPEAAAPPALPRRVAVAVDAESFTLNAASHALAPLLASWPAEYTVVHVTVPGEAEAFPGQRALGHLRASRLLPNPAGPELYAPAHISAAAGILQAVEDVQADLLVLVARPRSFLGRLFHRSCTAQVLRGSRVPVLLLPAEAPTQPGWMPSLS
ncbi:universal stress protein [Hymenobacter seoulensis]